MSGRLSRGRGRRARAVKAVETSAEWHAVLALALTCADDADRGAMDCVDAEARRATLSNRMNTASTGLFDRRAGAAIADVAKAWVRIARAFARRETPQSLRRDMAAMVADGATFLDLQLHRLATADFERAHHGRPEVYG